MLAPGGWKTREAGDEAVDENKLPHSITKAGKT